MLLFIVLFILGIIVNSPNTIAQQTETKKIRESTITFSSSYFEGNYTNDQIGIFGLELMELMSRLNDPKIHYKSYYSGGSKVPGILTYNLTFLLNFYLFFMFDIAYHEFGHGLRSKAFGIGYILPCYGQKSLLEKGDGKYENFFGSYFDILTMRVKPDKKDGAYSYYTSYNIKELISYQISSYQMSHNHENIMKFSLITTAGGINNETYLSEKIGERIYFGSNKIGISECIYYFITKYSIIGYASLAKNHGDPVEIEEMYREMGTKASKKDIITANIISAVLSGTTYSFIKGITIPMWRTSLNNGVGDFDYVKPIEFKGFRMPDVFSYITTRGISYKIISGYSINQDFKLLFGTEFIGHGKFANEFNLGFMKSFFIQKFNSKVVFKVLTFFGQGFNIEWSCSIPFQNRLSINFGGGNYSNKSLHGERHSMDMKNINDRSQNIFMSLSYTY